MDNINGTMNPWYSKQYLPRSHPIYFVLSTSKFRLKSVVHTLIPLAICTNIKHKQIYHDQSL